MPRPSESDAVPPAGGSPAAASPAATQALEPFDGLPGDAQALVDALVAISSDLALDSVLDRLVRVACELTGARYGALGVLGGSGRLTRLVTYGITPEQR